MIEFGPAIRLGRPLREEKFAGRPADFRSLVGVACLYGAAHPPVAGASWQRDEFRAGCFRAWIAEKNTKFRRMHAKTEEFGSTDDGTLELFYDEEALRFRVTLADDYRSTVLFFEVANRSLSEASVGFGTTEKYFRLGADGKQTRVITEAMLGEISVVWRGAVPDTVAAAIDRGSPRLDLRADRSLPAFRSSLALVQLRAAAQRLVLAA